MAGRREESRFAYVGLIGFRLGDGEFQRPGLDAPFKVLVGTCKSLGGGLALGDVGVGHNDAALGHGVDPHFDHAAIHVALVKALHRKLVFDDPVGDELFDDGGVLVHSPRLEADDLVERRAYARVVGRQHQDFAVLAIPADELHLLVEDSDALANVVKGALQQIAIVLNRLRSLVEQPQGRLAAHIETSQHERRDKAGGRRANGAGQQVFCELDGVRVRLPRRGRVYAAARHVVSKGPAGSLLAEIARDGRHEFIEGNAQCARV